MRKAIRGAMVLFSLALAFLAFALSRIRMYDSTGVYRGLGNSDVEQIGALVSASLFVLIMAWRFLRAPQR